MADKVLRLHPKRGFFSGGGIHLVNPEKPVTVVRPDYEPSSAVLRAIELGILIDINQNILVKESTAAKKEAEAAGVAEAIMKKLKKEQEKEAAKEVEAKPEVDEVDEKVESKPKGKSKK